MKPKVKKNPRPDTVLETTSRNQGIAFNFSHFHPKYPDFCNLDPKIVSPSPWWSGLLGHDQP